MDGQGRLEISVFTRKRPEKSMLPENEDIVVQMRDSGRGIPEELQAYTFELFFTTKSDGEGSGLGLDIARRIIDKHRGTITLESRTGRTTFCVSLPKLLHETKTP